MKVRKRLNDSEASSLGLELKPHEEGRKSARYYISEKQVDSLKTFKELKKTNFKTTKKTYDKNGDLIGRVEKRESKELIDIPTDHQIKRVSTNVSTGQQWVITEPKKKERQTEEIDFESIIKKHIKPVKRDYIKPDFVDYDFDSLTVTDIHIGMDTDSKSKAMYGVSWYKEDIINCRNKVVSKVIEERKSNTLIIDDLGDLPDGLNKQTTRGGHPLPQLMTDEESFDLSVEFKVGLVDNLVNYYDEIIVNNVCNDNHGGKFAYFINQMVKQILELKHETVKVTNHRTFFSHYVKGEFLFIITHGKDEEFMKFGLKPQLDTKQIEKIDGYIKQNNLYALGKKIIIKKGDSHQALFDMATSDDFFYFNYPALSPSSEWVQTNFKKGRRGFFIEHFRGTENKFTPIFL